MQTRCKYVPVSSAPAIRPPWMAGVPEMQEHFSALAGDGLQTRSQATGLKSSGIDQTRLGNFLLVVMSCADVTAAPDVVVAPVFPWLSPKRSCRDRWQWTKGLSSACSSADRWPPGRRPASPQGWVHGVSADEQAEGSPEFGVQKPATLIPAATPTTTPPPSAPCPAASSA